VYEFNGVYNPKFLYDPKLSHDEKVAIIYNIIIDKHIYYKN